MRESESIMQTTNKIRIALDKNDCSARAKILDERGKRAIDVSAFYAKVRERGLSFVKVRSYNILRRDYAFCDDCAMIASERILEILSESEREQASE